MASQVHIPTVGPINMPVLGFGTWQVPPENVERLVAEALEVGYTHIDCAHVYANEHEIGKTFEKLENRNAVYIVSKLWSSDHEPHRVAPAIDLTLKNLRLNSLDLFLMHNPLRQRDSDFIWYSKEWVLETWRAMVKLLESEKTKRIGVSNFTTAKLNWLLDEGEIPSNNQVELHPYLRQEKLVKFCKDNDIALTAYSPLGSPATANSFPGLVLPGSPTLLEDPVIAEVAKRHTATPAQVLIKWSVQRGIPALVKSSSKLRMIENLRSLNVNLTDHDMASINSITTQCRYLTFQKILTGGHTLDEYWDNEYYN